MTAISEHSFGAFRATVPDDIGDAAVLHMQDTFIISDDLTAETTALLADLFAWCRTKLESDSRPIPMQQALRIASEAMADPDDVGIRIK